MAKVRPLILTAGGLRSLVATAMTVRELDQKVRPILLHIIDGRAASRARVTHVHRQADAFGIKHIVELDMLHIFGGEDYSGQAPKGLLAWPTILLTAMQTAVRYKAGRVVWPVAPHSQSSSLSQAVDQVMLVEQLALSELPEPIAINTPLLELSDQQVLELGAQLQVKWSLAWSCMEEGKVPCRQCDGCRRRAKAMTAAGMVDSDRPTHQTLNAG